MPTKLRDGETILFIGDSITDCGRSGSERPLGNGYVKMFRDLLVLREPALDVTIINKGISGHTLLDLQSRWTDDVLRHRPDWLSVKIGINDLHQFLGDTPRTVPPAAFAKAYDEVLSRTRAKLPKCRILLIDPFYISQEVSPNSFRSQVLKVLPRYIAAVHRMSRKYRARLVRTHAMYQKLLQHWEADTFCGEPVHPNFTGHLAIAEQVYTTLSE